MIRDAAEADAAEICRIYNPFIAGSTITFEEQPVAAAAMRERIAAIVATLPWLVYESDDGLAGYAYANHWRVRAAYRHSVETTIYLDERYQGRGIGPQLYGEIISRLRRLDLHRAIGGIALPNAASVKLHERLGFRKVAHFEEVGRKFDRWIDVGYWQLAL